MLNCHFFSMPALNYLVLFPFSYRKSNKYRRVVFRCFKKIITPVNKMEHFKLIIIGAGASGIAAASKLLEKGFSDFRIIEAENRIGGRICTTSLGSDKSIELGAEWIHGEKDNIVFELASKFDLADNSSPSIVFTQTSFFDFSGHQVNKDISVALTETYQDIINTEDKNFDSEVLKGSLGHYFEVEFQKRVNELRNKLNISDDLKEKFVKVFENYENSIDASNSWYETSLSGHLEYWECDGNILTTWKDKKYNMIFDILTKKIPDPDKQLPVDDKILFNKEVKKVNWNAECNSKNVVLGCSDGTVYSADHILVTCSLGVLKERAENMFFPSLPKQKLKCIQNLGFGTVDKIFVKFSHRWWEKDSNGFGFLWSKEERENDSSGWLNGIICFHPIDPDSLIMRGWVVGEAAQQMECLPHKEIVDGIKFLFDKFLGSAYKIPALEIVSTSRWYSNPHFRGSYSCRLLVSESANVWASQLAQPVCDIKGKPVLLFGGEATHDHYFSTVHGAIEAGYREAERLLPFLMENCKKYFQVVIIGAGISGLSAATTLIENGLTDVVILEAQTEPGGRIRSLQVGDYCLELGAQWIHGDKNEVFTICKENDLVTEEYSSEGEGLYLRENGEKIDEDIVREVDDVIKDILENCENYVGYQSKNEIPHSIGQELLLRFNQYLEGCTEDTEEIKKIKRELFGWHIRFQLIDNSCSDLFNLSAKAWGLFKFCGGNDYVNFKKGYSSLIDTLVNRLPQNTISYETSAECVEWMEKINHGSDYCAKIKCNNGITYFSQFVIVTSSLGYLKRNYKKMFHPPLPAYLTKAIEFLDFGVINKIFLIYDKPWWDSKVKGFQLVWSEEESTEKHWSRYVTGFDVILKNKPILLGWVGGEGAKVVEQMSEDEVGREATELLRRFTRKQEIPLPDQVIRTKWWCNKYVRGAYSHITIKCDESDISGSNLAEPVYSVVENTNENFKKPTIFFAGESAHKNHFSTVHGAYESGQSQAKAILEYVLKQKC